MAAVSLPLPASEDVRAHLEEVLESTSFRTSARSRQFLQYVVDESLAGRSDSLKERVVGERVFGRDPAYDTGQDSIVRVKANEVRRRLAQYYDQHPHSMIRIEMVSGSYGVTIRRLEGMALDEAEPVRPRRFWPWLAAVSSVVVLLAAFAWHRTTPVVTAFDLFWQPFLAGSRPILLCMPAPEAFRIYGKDRQELIQAFRPVPPSSPRPAVPRNLPDVRIVPEPGLLVGLGDARALAYLQAFASTHHREVHVRASAMTSFGDLSAGPSLVIGGETNQWNADLTSGSRFALGKVDGRNVILDRRTNQPACIKPHPWESPASQDCALVTRLRHATTGHPLMLVAGLDHYGTYAVGEFVTSPQQLLPALAKASADWADKNLQILFKVDRLRDGIGPPRLQAIHVW